MSDEFEAEGDISDLQQSKNPEATDLTKSLIDDLFIGQDPYVFFDAIQSTYADKQERIVALLDTNRQDVIDELMTNGAAEQILDGLIDLICTAMEFSLEEDGL